MSVSIREYIRWLPDGAPTENTDTLVLTSPGRRFVDIRMLLKDTGKGEGHGGEGELTDTVDWAFAGTSSSSEVRNEDGRAVRHCVWRHVVDSRTRTDPETAVVDEADMFPPEDGDRVLEKGRMVNPDTGLATDYEEMWRDVEPEAATTPGPAASTSPPARPRCIVLELRDDPAERRGQVVCLGRYCQGVVRCGPDFALERWAWEPEGGWARRVRVGPLHLPCEEALRDSALAVGASVRKDGLVWTVVEACET